tara:strand:- start:249 stop:413 length:165 start_codon:yes stop_codon:yes gene_type:complete
MVQVAFEPQAISQGHFASPMNGLLSKLECQRPAGQERFDDSVEGSVDIIGYFMH